MFVHPFLNFYNSPCLYIWNMKNKKAKTRLVEIFLAALIIIMGLLIIYLSY